MDAKRFGRALGEGTRALAKAAVKAADAATAPNPAVHPSARPASTAAAAAGVRRAIEPERVLDSIRQVHEVRSRALREGQNAGRQMLAPVARAAGTLGLEITGVFFGIFALGMASEAWHRHADLTGSGSARYHAWFVLALALAFGYFTVSNFVRASRRDRR